MQPSGTRLSFSICHLARMSKKLYVCISLDVEEEGLFSGRYIARNPPVTNLVHLARLFPLIEPCGFKLTLFCAYAVFQNAAAWAHVEKMAETNRLEIGAHLHHWSTPPWGEDDHGEPVRTHLLSRELLQARLTRLLEIGAARLGRRMTSFRMGRWDLKRPLLAVLAELGIEVDSSICPLRAFKNGADHFLVPPEPYWIETRNGKILEAPITQIPLFAGLSRFWRGLCWRSQAWLDKFHFFGALSANPVWHSLGAMKLATRLHFARGGRVLNFFWHSSELMPGASPNIPDQASADRLVQKIMIFCDWLQQNFEVEPVTASQLAALPISANYPVLSSPPAGDW